MSAVPIEFVLFALALVGIAVFSRRTLEVALAGLSVIIGYKLVLDPFKTGPGLVGLASHLQHEWVILANLGLLLLGFALLAVHFEQSGVPKALPRLLPADWTGPLWMLVMVFVLSSFLDNIAAAAIGGAMAHALFQNVHLGYIVAMVAAANAGGSGSVVGDTTTTMMWIAGVPPSQVLPAYVAATAALFVCGVPAALQQHTRSPMRRPSGGPLGIDWLRVLIVIAILLAAVVVNIAANLMFPAEANAFPFLGVAVWVVLLISAPIRSPDWKAFRGALKGTAFLLALVLGASMMPVERLPAPSWRTTFAMGFLSAVVDNIPLTSLALQQGGYDWGMLAYAVGFGGSMIWFGSSAGVAMTSLFPEARSVGLWLKEGWHVVLAYVIGFFTMLGLLGWRP